MVKKILKNIFPILFLKRIFLVWNSFKIATIYKFLFPEYKVKKSDFIIYKEENPFHLIDISSYKLDEVVYNEIEKRWKGEWVQDQYILNLKQKVIIEPDQGWGMVPPARLIYTSLGFGRAPYLKRPDYFKIIFKEKTYYPQIISLRDTGEENYFHFFNDILPKFFYLRENGFDYKKLPVVIAKNLYDKPYFQYFLEETFLKDVNWIVQEREIIESGNVLFCKPFTHTKRYYDEVLKLIPAPSDKPLEKRVFLNRSNQKVRHLENIDAVINLVTSYNFEIVDADTLSFKEQINLFYNTKYLVGIHGAGLTNIMFRRGHHLSLLEIFHTHKWIPFHYLLLSKMFNYKYDCLLGVEEDLNLKGGFNIDLKLFNEKIKKMLNLS